MNRSRLKHLESKVRRKVKGRDIIWIALEKAYDEQKVHLTMLI